MEAELIARLEAAVARLEAMSSAGPSPPLERGLPDVEAPTTDPAIAAFDDLVLSAVGRVKAAAGKIGGTVQQAAEVLEDAFRVQKELLLEAKKSSKPDLPKLQEFLKPLNEVILKANELTQGRRSEFFNHLKATSDSLTALAWIAYTGKDCGMPLPISQVEESWQMAEFYNNKVLVEHRNRNADHVEWAKALKELYLPVLRDFVKKHYPLGPVWSSTADGAASSSSSSAPKIAVPTPQSSSSSTAKVSVSGPAPSLSPIPKVKESIPSSSLSAFKSSAPKTSSPAPAPLGAKATVSKPKEGTPAIFRELTSAKSVAAGLKKVSDEMKTKNRSDKTGVVEAVEKDSRRSSFSFKTGPPKLELQMGRKWVVENQIGKKNLVIDDCDPKQSVYIFSCKDSVLQIKGKVNNITFDKCTKMGLLFTDVVAACEIVNCNSVEVQCQGSAPTISIDNTAGCQLYLSKTSLGVSITTAKSSEINIMVPGAGPEQDWVEHALPQQFVHLFKNGQFTTTPASHSGG